MNFIRRHWFDIGGIAGVIILVVLLFSYQKLSNYQLLMWLSLTSLFFHQMEEYRIAGTFPGMVNRVMFNSDLPDRYPLNSNTSLIINVYMGWSIYLLAVWVGDKFVWLGMATILVSLGNIIAHTFVFNFKGKTLYNAGLITCWLFFAPCVFFFFRMIHQEHLATNADYLIGVPLGIIVNIFGVLKPITWLADKNTSYVFKSNQLLPKDR
ncbi:HXXEE domain-containing protein [Sphingobacterium sp. SGG-5]|uniref:HXXEE domain-containing protein n=1 Tax=Sphingobacterium sp. SGG-5 TaxID=2710881 RepID=UPI0013EB0263|nr:HXXEE domain-containing protein [Sphingobacterium sp. SGG-5]NGM61975.1 HXXEE domain-containing protein [Sphingobacterium sp. SGG-5]